MICEGAVYARNNFSEWEPGVYTQSWTAENGCDSIVTLHFTVNPAQKHVINASVCQGSEYEGNGFREFISGTYSHSLQSVAGCDSVVSLVLTVNPVYNDTIHASICQGDIYSANGFSASSTGFYSHTSLSAQGCDSTMVLSDGATNLSLGNDSGHLRWR